MGLGPFGGAGGAGRQELFLVERKMKNKIFLYTKLFFCC